MKKFLALALTLALLLSFAACGGKENQKSENADVTEEIATEATDVTASPDEGTEIAPEETTEEETTVEETTTEEETTEEITTEAAAAIPEGTEAILAYYNDAVNKAYEAKVGFNKKRYTDSEQFDMSLALKAFKSLVEKFVGIGSDNIYTESVTKGNWDSDSKHEYLRKATLTSSDLKSAEIKESGDNYIITLSVKGGSSVGNKSTKTTSAPIDKCGICVGDEDKNYYDHKTGPVIYSAIGGTYSAAKIEESYTNAKVYATVNAETGEISSLKVEFDISVAIDIGIGKGTATGTTHVVYSDFAY